MKKLSFIIIPCLVAVIAFASFENKALAFTPLTAQIGVGSSGSNVTNLQTFLASNSSVYPQGLVTGYYGPLTINAVNQFQIGYGMPPVGRVGPQTLLTINSLIGAGRNIDVNSPVMSAVTVAVTNTTARFSWDNNEQITAKIFYSSTPIVATDTITAKTEPYVSGLVMTDLTSSLSKSITVTGLNSETTYYYVIEVKDTAGNITITLPKLFTTK